MKFKLLILPFLIMTMISMILSTGIGTASAVNLGIKSSNSIKYLKTVACTSANINVGANPSYNITINNIPASCLNKSLSVQIIASDGTTTQLFTGTVTTNVTFSNAVINPATITQVKVAIAGWEIPARWLWVTPALYVDASTPDVSISNSWTYYSATSFCVTLTLSTTSSGNIPWSVNLLYNKYPFNGDANAAHYNFTPSGNYKFISTSPVNGIFRVTATKTPNSRVKAGSPQVITICNATVNAP